jgi:V/A-type H+-transporting ATPase subunit C
MSSKFDYSAITTKIRAMNENLLSQEQYVEIAGLSSIPELISYLKTSTVYAPLLSSLNEQEVHREQLEKMISNSLYLDFTRLYKFSNATQKQFLRLYFKRYEVAIVKECLCNIIGNNDKPVDLSLFYDFFKNRSKIDVIQLSTAKSITELIEYLKDSDLYDVLSNVNQYAGSNLFDYETQLDLYYFKEIWRSRKKFLTGEDLDAITEIYGKKIDLLNMQWIVRAKKNFNLIPNEIYSLIIPIQYKLKHAEFNAMIEADSLETLSQLIGNSYYGKQLGNLNAFTIEDTYLSLQHLLNNKSSRLHPYSVAIINSYLYNKEREKNRLITAIECIRYKMDPDTILAYITK